MSDKAQNSENSDDNRACSTLVSCQSSSNLSDISRSIFSTLEKTIEEDTGLSDGEKNTFRDHFVKIFESALQENINVAGGKWENNKKRDTLECQPVDSTLTDQLNGDLPRRTNEAITVLAQKRKKVPAQCSSILQKRLKLRRRFVEHVPCEPPGAPPDDVTLPVSESDPEVTSLPQTCTRLGQIMEKLPTLTEDVNLVTSLYKAESTAIDVITRTRRPSQSSKPSKSHVKKLGPDENQNLIKDLTPQVFSEEKNYTLSLRRRKKGKS